jgi:PIN domain nuclease of toxin-antitoxin system
VIVLDAYALEAYLNDEVLAADAVEPMLLSGEQVLISGVNLAETLDRMIRLHGMSPVELEANLLGTGVHVSSVDEPTAFDAARLRAAHYHRTDQAVSIADCCAAALALDRDAPLVTSDPALLSLIADENGRYIALPDSAGNVWSP